METKDTCFCEKSLIDTSVLVLEILREGGGGRALEYMVSTMGNRVNI